MRGCNTNVARALGYMSSPGIEERAYVSPVSIMGPSVGRMTSYHTSGMSSKEEYLAKKRYAECVRNEFRL